MSVSFDTQYVEPTEKPQLRGFRGFIQKLVCGAGALAIVGS